MFHGKINWRLTPLHTQTRPNGYLWHHKNYCEPNMFRRLRELYNEYKPYVRVDLIMYGVLILSIVLYFIFTALFGWQHPGWLRGHKKTRLKWAGYQWVVWMKLLFRCSYFPWLFVRFRIGKHHFDDLEGNKGKDTVCQNETEKDW